MLICVCFLYAASYILSPAQLLCIPTFPDLPQPSLLALLLSFLGLSLILSHVKDIMPLLCKRDLPTNSQLSPPSHSDSLLPNSPPLSRRALSSRSPTSNLRLWTRHHIQKQPYCFHLPKIDTSPFPQGCNISPSCLHRSLRKPGLSSSYDSSARGFNPVREPGQ